MTSKTGRHCFQVQLNWLTGKTGLLSSHDAPGTIHVSTPPAFGGEGKPWTPEHFLLGAISSCFMTTYLAFSKKFGFEFIDLECESVGQVELVDGKYKFTKIDLYPKIYIEKEELKAKAELAMEKAHKYCLIGNSVNAELFYHGEIIVNPLTDPSENPVKANPEYCR